MCICAAVSALVVVLVSVLVQARTRWYNVLVSAVLMKSGINPQLWLQLTTVNSWQACPTMSCIHLAGMSQSNITMPCHKPVALRAAVERPTVTAPPNCPASTRTFTSTLLSSPSLTVR